MALSGSACWERRTLRHDFDAFFLGTAMTISRTGRPGYQEAGPAPKKATAALYRRGGPTSLAKTLQPRNKLAAAAGVLPPRPPNREKGPGPLISGPAPAPAGGWGGVRPPSPPAPLGGVGRPGHRGR